MKKPKTRVSTTVYPDAPTPNINDWYLYIHNEYLKTLVR